MPTKADWQSALAICAAIIGAGFASGREIVSFFSGFSAASWLGIPVSAAGIGLLIYVIMLLAARTRARSLPALYGALMGVPCRDALHMLHGLLCLMTASAMLAAGAELGALTFPLQHSRGLGFLITLLTGAALVCSGFRSLSALGALLVPLVAAYFCAMASGGHADTGWSADGLLAAPPMGLIYAAFNTALSGSAICLCGQRDASPGKTAALTGCMLLILLSCANTAMLRAGEELQSMALPSVVMAARWGIAGYYISILILWLSIITTLCAMLHSLRSQLIEARCSQTAALTISLAAAALMSISGFRMIIDIIYPLLGWVCAFVLVALLLFLPQDTESPE